MNIKSQVLITLFAVGTIAAQASTIHFATGVSSFNALATGGSYAPWSALGTSAPLPLLTGADFTAAQTAPSALVLNGLAGGWVNPSSAIWPGDKSAAWIGTTKNATDTGHSALYDFGFDVVNGGNATLKLTFSVDDKFGDSDNSGIYVDGLGLAGSTSNVDWNGLVETKTFNLGSLTAGHHDLAFNVYNQFDGPSGMLASGDIQVVPEPASFAVLGLGAFGLIARRRRG